jgi:hypothetical protein
MQPDNTSEVNLRQEDNEVLEVGNFGRAENLVHHIKELIDPHVFHFRLDFWSLQNPRYKSRGNLSSGVELGLKKIRLVDGISSFFYE